MSEFPHCDAVSPSELPGETERRIAAALLFVDEHAHDAYHHDAKFRVVVNSLAASLVPMIRDMAMASEVRKIGVEAAAEAYKRATWPELPYEDPQ